MALDRNTNYFNCLDNTLDLFDKAFDKLSKVADTWCKNKRFYSACEGDVNIIVIEGVAVLRKSDKDKTFYVDSLFDLEEVKQLLTLVINKQFIDDKTEFIYLDVLDTRIQLRIDDSNRLVYEVAREGKLIMSRVINNTNFKRACDYRLVDVGSGMTLEGVTYISTMVVERRTDCNEYENTSEIVFSISPDNTLLLISEDGLYNKESFDCYVFSYLRGDLIKTELSRSWLDSQMIWR